MKLWEAMLEGYKKVGRQHTHTIAFYNGSSRQPVSVCALGAANLHLTGNAGDIHSTPLAWAFGASAVCPACKKQDHVAEIVCCLNEGHHWTIPEIAAWVREQEEGIAAKEPEAVRELVTK